MPPSQFTLKLSCLWTTLGAYLVSEQPEASNIKRVFGSTVQNSENYRGFDPARICERQKIERILEFESCHTRHHKPQARN